jgi:TonB family protein
MLRKILTLSQCALILLGLTVTSSVNSRPPQPTVLRVNERSLRKQALKVVNPEYPENSRKKKVKGKALVEVEVDENGKVAKVDVTKAPDEDIKKSVLAAVKKWEFKITSIDNKPVRLKGPLTFTF